MRTSRFREDKELVQSHTADKWQERGSNQVCVTKTGLSPTLLCCFPLIKGESGIVLIPSQPLLRQLLCLAIGMGDMAIGMGDTGNSSYVHSTGQYLTMESFES